MKTNKIIIAATMLAMVAGGCTKDNLSIRLFREPMANGNGNSNAKVIVDPSDVNASQWVAGEQININGTPGTISLRGGDFYLDLENPIDGDMLAVYPTSINANGNKVTFATNTLTIENLNIDFTGSSHHVILPMAASAAADSRSLKFLHLTGGLKITLTDTSSARNYTMGSLRVVTYGDGATADPIAPRNGVTARWAKQGLTVPGGMVGQNGETVDAKYATQMDFTFSDGGFENRGKAITEGGSISFCVPITTSSVKAIQVTGFDPDGKQLFSRMNSFGSAKAVEANNMYSIYEIKF